MKERERERDFWGGGGGICVGGVGIGKSQWMNLIPNEVTAKLTSYSRNNHYTQQACGQTG